jgi:hypothetical protein
MNININIKPSFSHLKTNVELGLGAALTRYGRIHMVPFKIKPANML